MTAVQRNGAAAVHVLNPENKRFTDHGQII
jgi:hypothetical protein